MNCLHIAFVFAAASAGGYAQFNDIPVVYGDPAENCYNLSVSVTGTNATYSLTRIDASSPCDTNMGGTKQLFLVYHLTPGGVDTTARPTPFALGMNEAATVALPGPGVYRPVMMGGSAGPNYAFSQGQLPFTPLTMGEWEQAFVSFVGDTALWDSPLFDHLPFASPVYPVQLDGTSLTFGIHLHGRTLGVFLATDSTGTLHEFKTEILSGNANQATVTLPPDFSFTEPITVTLVDVTTSVSATWLVFDPLAARFGSQLSVSAPERSVAR